MSENILACPKCYLLFPHYFDAYDHYRYSPAHEAEVQNALDHTTSGLWVNSKRRTIEKMFIVAQIPMCLTEQQVVWLHTKILEERVSLRAETKLEELPMFDYGDKNGHRFEDPVLRTTPTNEEAPPAPICLPSDLNNNGPTLCGLPSVWNNDGPALCFLPSCSNDNGPAPPTPQAHMIVDMELHAPLNFFLSPCEKSGPGHDEKYTFKFMTKISGVPAPNATEDQAYGILLECVKTGFHNEWNYMVRREVPLVMWDEVIERKFSFGIWLKEMSTIQHHKVSKAAGAVSLFLLLNGGALAESIHVCNIG